MRRFVHTALELDPECGAAALEVGGGVAAFVGQGSPVNQAFGLGFAGPVEIEAVAQLEEFYVSRGARPLIGASPLAHPSLFSSLAARGWVTDGFENVLVRTIEALRRRGHRRCPRASRFVRSPTTRTASLWIRVAATAFSAPLPPLDEQLALGRIVVRRPGSRLFIAFVDGRAAGTGELYVEDGVAWLSADSTLPQFRRRGVQQALQRHRLALGAQAGCEIAATESVARRSVPAQHGAPRVSRRVHASRSDAGRLLAM